MKLIEKIPVDWEVNLLNNLAKFYSGGTPLTTREEYYNGEIPFIKSGEIYLEKTEQYISKDGLNNSSAKMVEKGDLLYALYGANSGEVAISKIKGAINQAILCIQLNSTCNATFIYNYLLNEKDRIIRKYLQGGQGNLSAKIVKAIPIPLPPLYEQNAIAQALNSIDTAIDKNNQLITKKVKYKSWLMQNLLTGEIRLEEFSGEWKEYSINELFEKTFRYVEWNEKESYNLISIRRRYGGLFFRGDLLGEKISVKKLKSIQVGDFLISKRQVSHGAWAVVSNEFHNGKVSDEYDCLRISNNKLIHPDFWKWFCQQKIMTHYAYLDSIGVHIEKLIFHYRLFKKRKVKVPKSIEEQIAIAKVLQTAEKEIHLLSARTAKLQEQKKGMMQVLLTGKKRLKINN